MIERIIDKGYKIFEAEEAHSALQVIEEHGDEIDLIISDVMMAGMGGPEMVQEIRKKYPDIKVIFISGYAEDAFVDEYGTDNNFNFLAKPFTLKQLALKVKEVME